MPVIDYEKEVCDTFALTKDGKYITKKEMAEENVMVPKHFKFDGITLKQPYAFFFTPKDLRQGRIAAAFHDYMCENKSLFKRKHATHILLKLWKRYGLSSWKAPLIYVCVELYQIGKGW